MIGHDAELLKTAEERSEMSKVEIYDLHRELGIAPPFEPMHQLVGKYPEYPEKGSKVWLRQKDEPELIAGEYGGKEWVYHHPKDRAFEPTSWQYRKE